MIGQRDHVAGGGPDARLERLVLLPPGGGVNEKSQQPAKRMGAFARLRGDLAFPPDCSQENIEAALSRGAAALDLEDRMGQSFDLRLDALDEIRKPVDDGLKQPDQNGAPALQVGLRPVAARHID